MADTPLRRPAWYFDVEQEGEGIVDVTTHLVDLIQWICFPEQVIDEKSIDVYAAKRWATKLSKEQFEQVAGLDTFPDYLTKDVKDGELHVYSNGNFSYTLNGVHAHISVEWNFIAPEGGGDTHYSVMRGSFCDLVIRQDKEQGYKSILYIEPTNSTNIENFKAKLVTTQVEIEKTYPGVTFKENKASSWEVVIPDNYKIGHEAHFVLVAKKYMEYLKDVKLPDWEKSYILTKYYTTIKALEQAKR